MSSLLPRLGSALSKRARRISKHLYQGIRWRGLRPRILMVVGCQHSGATLISSLFDADSNCRVFGEYSVLSSVGKDGIRLNPLPDVAAVLSRVPAPLVVIRPLVETQRARTLLNYFPDVKALFMYRRYDHVASSDLRRFGARNAIDNIRPIATGNTHDWRSTGTTATVRARISHFFSDTMSPNDAAALFWYARNQLFYDLELPAHREAMLCRYEDLIAEPVAVMRRIYEFAGVTCPDLSHAPQLCAGAPTESESIELLPEVRALCEQLQARLDAQCEMQSRLPVVAATAPDTCVPQLARSDAMIEGA